MSKPLRGHPRQPPDNSSTTGPAPADAKEPASSRKPSAPPQPARRPTYPEAVARFEGGMRALQEHRYEEAANAFRAVLTQYPEEKELGERVRVYLTACERQLRVSSSEPQDQEERLYAATLALNAGDIDRAVRHLEAVVAEDGTHDGALYMLGVGYALRKDTRTALMYLQRAIARNPANRLAALQDDDLEALLQDDSVRAALEGGDSSADAQ